MSFIPSSLTRVPNMLVSQLQQRTTASANVQLLRVQEQLATFKRVNRASDDAVAASLIGVLDGRLEQNDQTSRNLTHAGAVLSTLDQRLGSLVDSMREVKDIASSQIGAGSDSETRRAQASVIASKLDELLAALNSDFAGVKLFGGSAVTGRAMNSFGTGYRYAGTGTGLRTDLGPGIDFPITIGADTAVGALSSRVGGVTDLDPQLTAGTRIADLRGPAANNTLGSLSITIDDGVTPVTVTADLTEAETIGDVNQIIESAIRQAVPAALTGAYPSAVGVSGERIAVNNIATGYTIDFSDGPAGSTARALGIDNFTYNDTTAVSTNTNVDLDPRITDQTTIGSLNPAIPAGTVRFRNGTSQGTVNITSGMTVGQLREAVRQLNLGVRVDVDESGNSISVINEVSGYRMSIEDSGATTALALGIRNFAGTTSVSSLNGGRGVEIADGVLNPLTGLPEPNLNTDFRVTLTDGSTFDVDLVPGDMQTVQTVVNKINAAATAAGFGAVFTASVSNGSNGIVFSDTAAGASPVTVTNLNGYAALDLGLLNGTFSAGAPATFAGTDPATVRVDSLVSTLIDLRDALQNNDERGITFAGELFETDLDRLSSARALVGMRQARVEAAQARLEDSTLLDKSIKSSLQDVDFTEAATRFNLLQTQLQAGYTSIASLRPLSLMNFLG
ncbi:MAG TPA: flagellin [Phycisphaerales bacterium]|nr:flagellin [Phycisphaerales bacterium]